MNVTTADTSKTVTLTHRIEPSQSSSKTSGTKTVQDIKCLLNTKGVLDGFTTKCLHAVILI